MDSGKDFHREFSRITTLLVVAFAGAIGLVIAVLILVGSGLSERYLSPPGPNVIATGASDARILPVLEYWKPPDIAMVSEKEKVEELAYGRELIRSTAKYLGPGGSVMRVSNGMNCQNCHLEGGTKIFGNNYAAVASTYPKFRARSGKVETVEKRVNDCFERSLNGEPLDTTSREMKAIVSYIAWLGSNVNQGDRAEGAGLAKLETMDRAADPAKGLVLYEKLCETCHGRNGQGLRLPDGVGYQFPPLWGEHSYNQGAGLYRVSTFAQFIYANMPLGVTHDRPQLTEEEAWDISAYVNSLPRPSKDISQDWPDIRLKPFDHPFGPYADPFSETQHKYGPFQPIKEFYEIRNK